MDLILVNDFTTLTSDALPTVTEIEAMLGAPANNFVHLAFIASDRIIVSLESVSASVVSNPPLVHLMLISVLLLLGLRARSRL